MIAVRVEHLDYSYHDHKEALHDISFQIEKGESVALIGPNGAGKSTLLRHLNGLLPEDLSVPGAVRIFEKSVTKESVFEIHRRVGFLFQDPDDQLFCPTVYEDVAFGPQQFMKERQDVRRLVADSLAMVGLAGFEDRLPHHLSAGEKQKVCLAGILACEPEILVLDEPTSDLDPRGKRVLAELLMKLPVTKIMASHDLELVLQLCPRALLLDAGRLIADGSSAGLLSDEKLMLEHGLEKPHSLSHRHPH